MKSLQAAVIAIVFVLILSTTGATVLAATPRRAPPSRTGSTRSSQPSTSPGRDTYAVVRVGDKVNYEVQVLSRAEVIVLKKRLDDEYKKAMKAYQEAVKAARKNKDKSTLPKRPVRCLVQVVHAGFKTQADADDWRERNKTHVGHPGDAGSRDIKAGVNEKGNDAKDKAGSAKDKEKEKDVKEKGNDVKEKEDAANRKE